MDAGFLHGVWTAALLAVFAAIVVWAWSGRRKRDFDEAARLPLAEEAESLSAVGAKEAEDATEPHETGARHG